MMMTARAMNMAVGDFFGLGRSHLDNLDIKGQRLTSHRMIGVDIGELEPDLGNHHMATALLCLHLGNHARFPALCTYQMLDRYALTGVWPASAIGLVRCHRYTEGIPC